MSDDWDVIEELEFWDDYHAIYGPEPPSRRQQKKINKYNKRKAKEVARKQKEAEDRIAKKVAANIKAEQNKQTTSTSSTSNAGDAADGCAYIVVFAIVIIIVAVFVFSSCL